MNPCILPGIRVVAPILWTLLLIGLGAYVWSLLGLQLPSLPKPAKKEELTLSMLRSEAMTFLVTRRTTTQVVIQHEESNWAGQWRGVFWVTVSWRWGVNLQKLTDGDIRREGDAVIIRIPEPELLDFSVVPGTTGFISKSTALPKIEDFLCDGSQRRLLEQQVQAHAMAFAIKEGLLPSRSEIVKQLNESVQALRSAKLEIRFE